MTKLLYPTHSVGEHMIPFSLVFRPEDTVKDALLKIEKDESAWPNSEYIFVVDNHGKLVGVITFAKLLSAQATLMLKDVMDQKFTSITDHTHQKNAAQIAVKKGLETIPVTDSGGHFLGIVDAEQIFKILHEIHIEKLMHFSGVLDSQELTSGYNTKLSASVKTRLPWLAVGLLGGFVSIFLIEQFSGVLESKLSLAFFIPVLVYMCDAVGTQIQTIFVRYSALEKVHLKKVIIHETLVVSTLAFILSVLIFLFCTFWFKDMTIAIIVMLSMFLGVTSSVFIGILVPWALEKTDKDPAIGSGPFTTILQDLLSISIYFMIATALL